jgi:hypothetical protein
MNFISVILVPAGLAFENRLSRVCFRQSQTLLRLSENSSPTRQRCEKPYGEAEKRRNLVALPDSVTVISHSKMVLKLMEAHPHWLTAIVKKSGSNIPFAGSRLFLLRLRLSQDSFIARSLP